MIEISRNVTFGSYVNNGSALARMDPRAKVVCAVLLIALFSYINNFTALILCFLFCVLLQVMSHISLSYVLRGFRFVITFLAIIYIFQVIFYSSPSQQTTLIWHWWILSLSWEGIIHSAQLSIRVLLLYHLTSMLMFTTSLVDLTDGSEALLSPLRSLRVPVNELVMVFVVALKFVPILITEVERLTQAQAMRGVRFDKGNLLQRAYRFSSLLVPLFLSGFRRVDALTTAMEARGYRGGYRGWRRSKRRAMHLQRYDLLALSFTVLCCVGIVLANILVRF